MYLLLNLVLFFSDFVCQGSSLGQLCLQRELCVLLKPHPLIPLPGLCHDPKEEQLGTCVLSHLWSQHLPAEPDLCLTHREWRIPANCPKTPGKLCHTWEFQELSFRGWSSAYLPSGLSSQEFMALLLNPVHSYGFKEATAVLWVASHMWSQHPGTGLVSGAILGIR